MSKTLKEMELEALMNEIHNVDCLEFMKNIPDDYFDLVLTDPPYGIDCAKTINIKNDKKGFCGNKLYEAKEWDNKVPDKEVFIEIMRVSKHQIIFGGNYFTEYLPPSKSWIFWDKKDTKTQGSYFSDGELAWSSHNKVVKYYKYGWIGIDYVNNRGSEIKQHPTQKPTKLFEAILNDYKERDSITVFDPFMGSGTTAIACKSLGLDWCGCELEADYVEIANKRLEKVQGSLF